jgi:hypothetical protein
VLALQAGGHWFDPSCAHYPGARQSAEADLLVTTRPNHDARSARYANVIPGAAASSSALATALGTVASELLVCRREQRAISREPGLIPGVVLCGCCSLVGHRS